MILKKVLNAQRVRSICGSFAFLEHRFLRGGFLSSLTHHELILYVFLVLAQTEEAYPIAAMTRSVMSLGCLWSRC